MRSDDARKLMYRTEGRKTKGEQIVVAPRAKCERVEAAKIIDKEAASVQSDRLWLSTHPRAPQAESIVKVANRRQQPSTSRTSYSQRTLVWTAGDESRLGVLPRPQEVWRYHHPFA